MLQQSSFQLVCDMKVSPKQMTVQFKCGYSSVQKIIPPNSVSQKFTVNVSQAYGIT